MLMINRT